MFKKIWTVEDLKMGEVYTKAVGRWNTYGNLDINYSTILTKLIQEAGRWCEHYASDLFISWENLMVKLSSGNFEGGRFAFGFRQYGVDHLEWILSRLNDGDNKEYRSIWILDVEISDDEIIMKLGRMR